MVFCRSAMFFSSMYSLALTLSSMFFAFAAKLRVERVSEKYFGSEETVANRIVFEFPPSESLKIFVKIEFRYGM